MPGPWVPSTPDGESAPTLDLSAVGLARRLENQRPRERPLTATTRQDCSYDLMINPMATGTIKRPPADLRRPRGREALSTHPPTPADDTTSGSLEQPPENTGAPAALQTDDPRKTATWAWSKAETERRRHAAATHPTLAPSDAFADVYSTADDLAAVRLDADPDATDPHSQTIRGLLGGACTGCPVRPTSVELYHALRADNPTSRQRGRYAPATRCRAASSNASTRCSSSTSSTS